MEKSYQYKFERKSYSVYLTAYIHNFIVTSKNLTNIYLRGKAIYVVYMTVHIHNFIVVWEHLTNMKLRGKVTLC